MLFDLIIQNFSKINKHGINTILVLAVAALFVSFISDFFGSLLFFITLFSIYFFRDPDRVTPENSNGILFSPADGIVTSISKIKLPKKFVMESEGLFEGKEMMKVSIFLNVFDVHVNRSPIEGEIKKIIYSPGKFINVAKEKESEDNENNSLIIKPKEAGPQTIIVTQIAGLIARRIVCEKKQDDSVKSGEKFGIIKFGSRVNLYFPVDYHILVKKGQRMVGGETVIAFENMEKFNDFISKINSKKISEQKKEKEVDENDLI